MSHASTCPGRIAAWALLVIGTAACSTQSNSAHGDLTSAATSTTTASTVITSVPVSASAPSATDDAVLPGQEWILYQAHHAFEQVTLIRPDGGGEHALKLLLSHDPAPLTADETENTANRNIDIYLAQRHSLAPTSWASSARRSRCALARFGAPIE